MENGNLHTRFLCGAGFGIVVQSKEANEKEKQQNIFYLKAFASVMPSGTRCPRGPIHPAILAGRTDFANWTTGTWKAHFTCGATATWCTIATIFAVITPGAGLACRARIND